MAQRPNEFQCLRYTFNCNRRGNKKYDEELKNEFPTINWKAIAGMRDKMAHNYRGIDPEITFDIIKESLPELKQIIIQLFSRVSFDAKMLLHALKSDHYKHIRYLTYLIK